MKLEQTRIVARITAWLFILWSLVMGGSLKKYPERLHPPDFAGPVIAAELPKDLPAFEWAVANNEQPPVKLQVQSALCTNLKQDLILIIVYLGFFCSMNAWLSKIIYNVTRTKWLLMFLITMAAAADYVEDWLIYQGLGTPASYQAEIFNVSSIKWLLFFASILYLGVLIYKASGRSPFDQPVAGILVASLFASGGLGLAGLVRARYGHPAFVQHGASLLALTILFVAFEPIIQTVGEWVRGVARKSA